jgi:hypothetical protein
MPLRNRFFRLSLLPLLLTTACTIGGSQTTVEGSGTGAAEARDVSDFRSVSFALPGTLLLEQGEAMSVRIEGDDNLLPHIVTRVRNGDLQIGPEENTQLVPRTPIRVYVSAPIIEAIQHAGTGSVEAPNLRASELSVTVAGTGGARLPNLQAELLRVQLAGSGSLEVSGRARRQVLALAGSGGVEARDLESDSLEANVVGSGSATVNVRDQISANLIGSGSVNYTGTPQVTSRTVGSGRVNRLQQ